MKIFDKRQLNILDERPDMDDLFDYSNDRTRVFAELKEIDRSSLIAFVGKHGSGKSTFLHNMFKENGAKYITFDAWQFPDRSRLWDGLILRCAEEIGWNRKIKVLAKIEEGTNIDVAEKVEIGILLILAILSYVKPDYIPWLVILLLVLWIIRAVLKTYPIKRLRGFQDLFASEIIPELTKNGNLYIILEDTDRCGNEGVHFLETLSYFIRETRPLEENDNKIIFIVPINHFYGNSHQAGYEKSFDYIKHFPEHQTKKIDNLLAKLFSDNYRKEKNGLYVKQLNDFFVKLLNERSITIRTTKLILREACNRYTILKDADFRICVAVEASKYFGKKEGGMFCQLKRGATKNDNLITQFFVAIKNDNEKLDFGTEKDSEYALGTQQVENFEVSKEDPTKIHIRRSYFE